VAAWLQGIGSKAAVGFAAAVLDPGEKAADAGALRPHQVEEFARGEMRGGGAEKSFHAPLDVRAFPGAEPVALGDEPIVAQGG
jgi:hypothetical protein